MSNELSNGIRMLREQGHQVEVRIEFGKEWLEIDGMLASPEEIEHLAARVYSLSELEELYIKRRAEEPAARP